MNLFDSFNIEHMGESRNPLCATLSIVQQDAVEVGLVCLSKECLMGIQHKVDHLVSGRALETIAEPIDRHLRGCHGVTHELLQFQQVVVVDEFVCHVPIISIGFGDLLGSVCHLVNWLGRLIHSLHQPPNMSSNNC